MRRRIKEEEEEEQRGKSSKVDEREGPQVQGCGESQAKYTHSVVRRPEVETLASFHCSMPACLCQSRTPSWQE